MLELPPFSAGVGRTGTFITINHILEQVEKLSMIDVAGVINKIRQQRMKLVQTAVSIILWLMILSSGCEMEIGQPH